MIFYIIQTHRNLAQVAANIKLLASEGDFFLVNVDPIAATEVPQLESTLKEFGNLSFRVRVGMPVSWAGASQMYSWIDTFGLALESSHPWKYLINLSGDCLPLASSRTIAQHLEDESVLGKSVHHMRYAAAGHLDVFHVSEDPSDIEVIGSQKLVRFHKRVPALIDRALVKLLRDRKRDPTVAWRQRASLHVTDTIISRQLIIRRLLPAEEAQRRAQLSRVTLRGGRPWYAFRRDALARIMADPAFYRIVDMLKNYLCCDELFMQTYLQQCMVLRRPEIAKRNFHYMHGNPGPVGDRMVEKLRTSKAFFIRKVRHERCPLLVEYAAARIAGKA